MSGIERPETLLELKQLVLDTYARAAAQKTLPGWIYHVGQVATVTGQALAEQPSDVQLRGQVYSWSHDFGRVVEMGPLHTLVGA